MVQPAVGRIPVTPDARSPRDLRRIVKTGSNLLERARNEKPAREFSRERPLFDTAEKGVVRMNLERELGKRQIRNWSMLNSVVSELKTAGAQNAQELDSICEQAAQHRDGLPTFEELDVLRKTAAELGAEKIIVGIDFLEYEGEECHRLVTSAIVELGRSFWTTTEEDILGKARPIPPEERERVIEEIKESDRAVLEMAALRKGIPAGSSTSAEKAPSGSQRPTSSEVYITRLPPSVIIAPLFPKG